MVVQNLAVQRGQWLNFLCCYVIYEMENSVKNVYVPIKPQRIISVTRRWQYFAKDCL